jgi:hypothetical protein
MRGSNTPPSAARSGTRAPGARPQGGNRPGQARAGSSAPLPDPLSALKPETEADDSAFPSLKKVPATERAEEIIGELKEAILNPGRVDGSTGMAVGDWSKLARRKIIKAIRDAEMSAAMRELMSANRIGGLCVRVGFLLLAAAAAFYAFWFGAVFVWESYGAVYGIGAIASALGLCIAFVVAGLMMSGEDVEEFRRDVKRKFGDGR